MERIDIHEIKEKEDLKKSAEDYKQKLEEEVDKTLESLKNVVNISVGVGLGLLVGYTVLKSLTSKKEKVAREEPQTLEQKPPQNGFINSVVTAGLEMAGVVLLNIAKVKLKEYITNLNTFNTDNDENPGGFETMEK